MKGGGGGLYILLMCFVVPLTAFSLIAVDQPYFRRPVPPSRFCPSSAISAKVESRSPVPSPDRPTATARAVSSFRLSVSLPPCARRREGSVPQVKKLSHRPSRRSFQHRRRHRSPPDRASEGGRKRTSGSDKSPPAAAKLLMTFIKKLRLLRPLSLRPLVVSAPSRFPSPNLIS